MACAAEVASPRLIRRGGRRRQAAAPSRVCCGGTITQGIPATAWLGLAGVSIRLLGGPLRCTLASRRLGLHARLLLLLAMAPSRGCRLGVSQQVCRDGLPSVIIHLKGTICT